jgi:hypothetical protein
MHRACLRLPLPTSTGVVGGKYRLPNCSISLRPRNKLHARSRGHEGDKSELCRCPICSAAPTPMPAVLVVAGNSARTLISTGSQRLAVTAARLPSLGLRNPARSAAPRSPRFQEALLLLFLASKDLCRRPSSYGT